MVPNQYLPSHLGEIPNHWKRVRFLDVMKVRQGLQIALNEQQKIASVRTAADKEIELLETKLAHFKQEKKALMQQLLTGKRRLQVAETEVA
ncbi:hypothetical protein M892_18530 [Vibrio campbellii ATCC BAA-1116]|uniref:Restriction endonuclease subunit S n=1 Tax=Vibrio campbellii (strain ATCC BAA-1116) TaxID=2902295 RepID=A7N7U8_VIBC1|nr:hypothetical protein VIBHAR_06809 [Vibrio campbellii ATCC BAA-1116]AGU98212.1 hypothetical protein M892_18530 [Vibrio campbellii ATCC BAA-1116]